MDYEINIDQTTKAIKAIINDSIDKNAQPFNTYEEAKEKIKMDIVSPKVFKKTKKMIENLENALGANEDNHPLMITEGKDEDVVE